MPKWIRHIRQFVLWFFFVALGAVSAGAHAETISLKIGYPPGNSFDINGRLVARHLGRFLNNRPTIIVQNVPGAGSLRLAKMLLSTEPSDGSVMGIIHSGVATTAQLDQTISDVDPSRFNWIGSLSHFYLFCLVGKESGIVSVEDFLTKEFLLGSAGKSGITYTFPAVIKNLFNAKYKIVTGFQGGGDIDAAILRGEIQGRCGVALTTVRSFYSGDAVKLVLHVPELAARVPEDMRGLASLFDLVKSETDKTAITLALGSVRMFFPLVLPAGTAPKIVADYRQAFDRMVVDPEFLAEANKLGVDIFPSSGSEIEVFLKRLLTSDNTVINRARELIQ